MAAQYNSYTTHYKEAECLRQMVEPFLYNFGVDVVFHGAAQACSVFCLMGRPDQYMEPSQDNFQQMLSAIAGNQPFTKALPNLHTWLHDAAALVYMCKMEGHWVMHKETLCCD